MTPAPPPRFAGNGGAIDDDAERAETEAMATEISPVPNSKTQSFPKP